MRTALDNTKAGIHAERAALRGWLEEDFNSIAASVELLFCSPTDGRPMYFSHVDLALACAPSARPDVIQAKCLKRGYVYLVGVYYLIDSVSDGHSCHASDLSRLDLVALLPLITSAAQRHLTYAVDESQRQLVSAVIEQALAENYRALVAECEWRQASYACLELEHFHLWGRSNVLIALFKIAQIMACQTLDERGELLLQDALALLQRGDDLCDWREDFLRKNFTPFLRSTGLDVGSTTIEQLEKAVLLDGHMEEELSKVYAALADLQNQCNSVPNFGSTEAFIAAQNGRVQTKRRSLQEARANGI